MDAKTGRVTIPTDIDVIQDTLELSKRWGADAVRDCDGTDFPVELKDVGLKVYSTYYTTRKDNEWIRALASRRSTAASTARSISLLRCNDLSPCRFLSIFFE